MIEIVGKAEVESFIRGLYEIETITNSNKHIMESDNINSFIVNELSEKYKFDKISDSYIFIENKSRFIGRMVNSIKSKAYNILNKNKVERKTTRWIVAQFAILILGLTTILIIPSSIFSIIVAIVSNIGAMYTYRKYCLEAERHDLLSGKTESHLSSYLNAILNSYEGLLIIVEFTLKKIKNVDDFKVPEDGTEDIEIEGIRNNNFSDWFSDMISDRDMGFMRSYIEGDFANLFIKRYESRISNRQFKSEEKEAMSSLANSWYNGLKDIIDVFKKYERLFSSNRRKFDNKQFKSIMEEVKDIREDYIEEFNKVKDFRDRNGF